ncbi:carboxylesterase family protein [Amycolatopsis endophytica]|uniref:carboxylesterase family protein n=1 Tax=Amycolatopsis endophytica TaxID=860233 RepID=UPI001FE7AD19|nr:carboxylesterase family protein [Amycolatopsis endophytica]
MSSQPVARTATGAVRGRPDGDVTVFHAIPYAAPPVRFTPPTPPEPWTGACGTTSSRAAAHPHRRRGRRGSPGRCGCPVRIRRWPRPSPTRPWAKGACHCVELPSVFGTFDARRDARMLGEEIQGRWLGFTTGAATPAPPR